jgi:hypothetical protein
MVFLNIPLAVRQAAPLPKAPNTLHGTFTIRADVVFDIDNITKASPIT